MMACTNTILLTSCYTITEPLDFEAISMTLTSFPTSINITIINDTMLNLQIHTFFVVLSTNDSQVELEPEELQIDIIDDEGMSAVVHGSSLLVVFASHLYMWNFYLGQKYVHSCTLWEYRHAF